MKFLFKKRCLPASVLLLLLFPVTLAAQSFKVSFGDNSKMKYDFEDAVQVSNNQYIILKLKERRTFGKFEYTPSLLLVGPDMSTLLEKELSIEEKNSSLGRFEKFGNNVFFIYDSYDRDNKTTSVYAIKINEKDLSPISKTTLGTFESDSRSDQAESYFKFSWDSTKLLMFSEGPERKKENKKIFIGVFDTDLKSIWKKEIELPIEERYVSIYDEDITNDGKVFIAIKHYDKEVTRQSVREEGSRIPSYVYKLLVYSGESAKEKEISFNLNNQFIQGTKLVSDKAGKITVAGLYKRKHNGHINGAFYTFLDGNTSEVKSPKMVEFNADIIRLVDKDNFGSDKESDPGLYSSFKIRHILIRDNGSVDLISEYQRLDIVTYFDPQSHVSRTTYHYTYGDIVNTNIDKDGKAVFTRIPKKQVLDNSTIFLGYYPIVYKDKLVLLYNDDEDNIGRDIEKAPDDVRKFKKSVFAAATIDAKGSLTRQAIYSHRDEDYVYVPWGTSKVSDTKFLITADLLKLFKRRTKFGILEIQ